LTTNCSFILSKFILKTDKSERFFYAEYNEEEMWLPDTCTTDHDNVDVFSIDDLMSGN